MINTKKEAVLKVIFLPLRRRGAEKIHIDYQLSASPRLCGYIKNYDFWDSLFFNIQDIVLFVYNKFDGFHPFIIVVPEP